MKDIHSDQILLFNLETPFNLIESLILNSNYFHKIFNNPNGKIKSYIGSDININGSGFLWQGKNNTTFSFECSSKFIPNFMRSYFLKILYLNNYFMKENISIEINIYKNTFNNSTIIELCFGQYKNNDYTKWVKNKLLEFEIKDYFIKGFNNIKYYINNSSNEFIDLHHSIFIKAQIEIVYKMFRDFNNTAKVLGMDKIWDIKYKNNSIYSVNMNNDISIDYHLYKEIENNDKSKTIYYHKYKNKIPALNEWTKVDFYKIDENKCLIIHETKLPLNINSNIYNTIYYYLLYILKKLKCLIESNNKKS